MNPAPIHFGRLLLAGVISVALMNSATAQVNSTTPSTPSSEQPQLAPINPDFFYYQELRRLGLPTAPTSVGGRGLGLLPSPLSLSHLVTTVPQTPVQAFPASYDLRTYSKVTAVRNQGSCGACWTFATFGSMESVLLTAENRDFSENNLKNLHGFNWTPCAGGNSAMSMAYLARWSGPVEEFSDPYQATNTNTSPGGLSPQKHVQDIILIPVRGSSLANDALKTALTTYGAVYTVMTWDDAAYNTSTASYYYTGSVATNHGVTLVGWDDNYSRYNFSTVPAGNGAFLIKNSWGTSWGQSGYFWISYYDTKYASLVSMVPSNNQSTANFTRQYSYDPLGWVSSFGYNNPSAWYANVFTAAASEQLKAISTYAASDNTTYTVYVYNGVTGGPTSGTLASTTSGTFGSAGYHTVTLTTPVALTAGAKFSVVIQITTPGYNYPIPIEYSVSGFSTSATASVGQSYYGNNGTSWTDITTWNSTTNVCIKAFTGTVAPDLSITKTHSGSFTRGQTGATYTITVSNVGGGPTSGTVTVTDTLPAGLTVTGMSGTNWACSTSSYICTRMDALAAGSSYPAITLTVTVSSSAPSSVTNIVGVSVTGDPNSANNTASDPTTIVNPALIPDLSITKTHTGNFTLGQTGATYTITVQNVGAGATSGTVTVTDSVPTGLTATAISGTGWTCTQPSGPCTRSNALAAGGSYPAITLTVTVSTSAATSVTNIASVSGGGESNTANNQASDLTLVTTQLQFISVAPCRIMDTRTGSGYSGAFGPPSLVASNTRSIPIPSSTCGIPSTAKAYSLNVTAIPKSGTLAYLTIWPTGISQPVVSTLNSWDGSVLANAAIVPAGTSGAISVFVTNNADLVIDINGYFAPPTTGSLMFYPVTPCRVLDTRNANGTFGGPNLAAGAARSFPIRSSSCGIPATAQSYSLNVTAVPIGPLGYLTAWPTGQSQPLVSTLNSMDGTVLANAAIVPAGTSGAVSFYASNTTHLVVDINGYFAPPGTGGLNFYALTPCRVLDTRNANGPYGGPIINGTETRPIQVRSCACGLPTSAAAYSLNMTVVPPGFMSFLAAWPAGLSWSGVSTLNDYKGLAVANAALVPAGTSGAVNIYTSNPSHVIMDINGYFGQ